MTPNVLICAGLDPSGGAGLIADVRVVTELGARPLGVITAQTIQNTTGVTGGAPVDDALVAEQLGFVLSDIEVHAVKIGMIGSAAVARAIADSLQATAAPVVWDPVMHPSRGDLVIAPGMFAEALGHLRGHLALLTPNLAELAHLCDGGGDVDALAARLGCPVLVKGGHADSAAAIDVLVHPDGRRDELALPRLPGGEHVHGTGCALSSAIAARLAVGADMLTACWDAKRFVAARIAQAVTVGRGAAAIV